METSPDIVNQRPKIAVIYLTYPTPNWERDISRFMKSFERINYPKDRVELICVESKGKGERVQPWFETHWMPKSEKELPRITYICNDEWIGFSGNNNIGLEKAKALGCKYVHLTNEDTDVDPDYLSHAVSRAEKDPCVAIVQSLLLLGEERDKVNSVGNRYHYLGFGYSGGYGWTRQEAERYFDEKRKTDPELNIHYASGAGALVRISALDGEQLFDEKFFSYHEDTDASLMARIKGGKVVVEPNSVIYHYYEFGKSKQNFFWMERNRYALMFSYYSIWTLLLLLPIMTVMDFGLLLFSFKSGWWRQKLAVYYEWLMKDYWHWIRKRRKQIQAVRKISDKELLKYSTPVIEFQGEGVKNPLLEHVANPSLAFYWALVRWLI